MGTSCAEWWHIQDAIAPFARCVTYDRAGYGWSEPASAPRTSQHIAHDLNALLQQTGLPPPYIFVGHSQGGLYINHYARLFPEQVEALIFVDPLSPRDNAFEKQLSPEVFHGSGVDKTRGIRLLLPLSKTGLLRLLKPLMLKSPPFYYYKNIAPEITEIIWQHLLRPSAATTALDEYRQAHLDANNQALLGQHGFPQVPVTVIYHTPEIIIDEIMKYGGLEKPQALAVEQLWESLVREYVKLSPNSQWSGTTRSSHFVHMDEPQRIVDAVRQRLTE